jgi:hypothetical protein
MARKIYLVVYGGLSRQICYVTSSEKKAKEILKELKGDYKGVGSPYFIEGGFELGRIYKTKD